MKAFILILTLYSTATLTTACPAECYCFGFNGEWIADCARKNLKSVTFGDFDANTTEIHMQYNEIGSLDGATFATVPKLRHLYLQANKITELPDGIFDNLPELETLRLNGNKINDIEGNKFQNLGKLQLLYIHNNDIDEIGSQAFNGLDKVEQISVAGNPNLASIDTNAFSGKRNLTMVDMSGSALTNIDPELVSNIPNLEKVYTYDIDTLDCKAIQAYLSWMHDNPSTALGQDSMVCALPENLRGRSVDSVDPDKHLTAVGVCPEVCTCFGAMSSYVADCSSKDLTEVPVGFAPETTEIFLQNNKLTSIPDYNFLHLTKLEYLQLHDNQLIELGLNAFTGPAQSLKQLTLNNNNISTLTAGVFNGMRSLQVLNLNNNKIGLINPREFSDLSSLVQLSMNYNSITALPEEAFSILPSLKYFGAAKNLLINVPDMLLSNSPNLYFVDYSGNPLLSVPKIPAGVTRFEVRDSHIMSLNASVFENAENLAILDLSNSRISIIKDSAFVGAPNLQYIYLKNSHLEEVSDTTFASAPKLSLLDLTGSSRLTAISDNAFYEQRRTLQILDLDGCGISTMSSKVLSIMQHPSFSAKLNDNPWNCDCKLRELSAFISMYPEKVDEPTCKEPKDLQGIKISEIIHEDICVISGPEDESLALVLSLSIVGAVLLFAVVVGLILHNSNSAAKASADAMAIMKKPRKGDSSDVNFSNIAYDYAKPTEAKTEL